MKQKGFIFVNIVLILFLCALIIIIAKIFLNFQKSRPIDTSNYINKYSNGWYGYTIRYPSNYYILYGDSGIPGSLGINGEIITSRIVFRDTPMGKGSSCMLSVVPKDEKHPYDTPIHPDDFTKTKQIEFNGISWRKLSYTSLPGNAFYEYNGVKWQTEKDTFLYLFQANDSNERECESLVSTFNFGVDPQIKPAVEAEDIKRMAVEYALVNFPDLKIGTAAYIAKTPQNTGKSVGLLTTTNQAIVTFFDINQNNIHKNSKYIFFKKNGGSWQIESVTDDPWSPI